MTPQPVPYADLNDPQSLNLYAYVRNNPLSKVDPDGHADWFQKLRNSLNGDGWKTDKQLEQQQPPPPAPPGPPFLKPNPMFKTVDAAGMAAAKQSNANAQQQGVEYGTRVFKIAEGMYSYSDLVTQNMPARVDPDDGQKTPRIPVTTQLAGEAHAHPDIPGYATERYSNVDVTRSSRQKIPTYLGIGDRGRSALSLRIFA